MIMSFWAPALNSPADNSIPKKSLDTLLSDSSYQVCFISKVKQQMKQQVFLYCNNA